MEKVVPILVVTPAPTFGCVRGIFYGAAGSAPFWATVIWLIWRYVK